MRDARSVRFGTGATGLIGKRLVRYYEGMGASIHMLSRKGLNNPSANTKCFQFDLRSCSTDNLAVFVAGGDIVFHCAAELCYPSVIYELNVAGVPKLYQAAVNAGVPRWVQLCSVGVYGRPRSGLVDEAYVLDPQNDYERSKLAANEWLCAQALQNNIELGMLTEDGSLHEDYEMWLRIAKRHLLMGIEASLISYLVQQSNVAGNRAAETLRAILTVRSVGNKLDIPQYLAWPNIGFQFLRYLFYRMAAK